MDTLAISAIRRTEIVPRADKFKSVPAGNWLSWRVNSARARSRVSMY